MGRSQTNRKKEAIDATQYDRFMAPILREIIFEDKTDLAQKAAQEDEDKLIAAIRSGMIEGFALHYFGKYLSPKGQAALTPRAISNMSRMLHLKTELEKIRDAMQAEKIDFIAFKGSDIAFRCYPLESMRYMLDLDLLFHKDDLQCVPEILRKLGWDPTLEADNGYHIAGFGKKGLAIEPHYKIPFFPDAVQEELWQPQNTLLDNRGIRVFSPEIAFLITFLHLERSKWGNLRLMRFMLDTAFLLKNNCPDWNKLAETEKHWGLPDARILPKAMPELIPDELVPNDPPVDPELQKLFSFLLHYNFLYPAEVSEATLNRADIFTGKWWKQSLHIFNPVLMRNKYRLPKKGCHLRLAGCYAADIVSKTGKLTNYLVRRRMAPVTQESFYLQKMQKYEKITAIGHASKPDLRGFLTDFGKGKRNIRIVSKNGINTDWKGKI